MVRSTSARYAIASMLANCLMTISTCTGGNTGDGGTNFDGSPVCVCPSDTVEIWSGGVWTSCQSCPSG